METQTKPRIFTVDRKLVTDHEKLRKISEGCHAQGQTRVLLQGVFDMLHYGHVKYMEIAASLGKLFVGVDDDAMVRQNKGGKDRPFDTLEKRQQILAALEAVSYIIPHRADQPNTIIAEIVRPEIMVISKSSKQYAKGEETFEEMMRREYLLPGYVGEIVVLDPQTADSTTEKMRILMKSGMREISDEMMAAFKVILDKHLTGDANA